MLFLFALVSFARAQVEKVSVTTLVYNYDDADCSGDLIGVQTFVHEMDTCEDEGEDDEHAYEMVTCNGNEATSTAVFKDYGTTECSATGATSTDTTLTQDTCMLFQSSRVKLQFNCADGSAYNSDSLTSGMIGYSTQSYVGSGCSGTSSSADDQKLLQKADVCAASDENEFSMVTCDGGTLQVMEYTDSACTTMAAGGKTDVQSTCQSVSLFGIDVSVKMSVIGCSGATELTIFGLALIAFFRF